MLPGKHETLLLWRDSLDFLHLALDVQNLTRNSVVNQVNTPVIAMTDGVSTATWAWREQRGFATSSATLGRVHGGFARHRVWQLR